MSEKGLKDAFARHAARARHEIGEEARQLSKAVLRQTRLTPVVIVTVFLLGMATECVRRLPTG